MEIALTSKQIQRLSDFAFDLSKGFIATGILPVVFDTSIEFNLKYAYFLTNCILSFYSLVVSLKLLEEHHGT